MTALEEITQAIETLERLKAESTGGTWEALGGSIETDADPYEVTPSEVSCITYCYGGSVKHMRREDAELIVTLHRTLDAQIAILEVARAYGELGEGHGSQFIMAAKVLARAVNGETK